MNKHTEHTDWLNEYPVLQKQRRDNPFLVPDQFFTKQQEQINAAIFAEELKSKSPSTGFNVPDNYFENLQGQLLSVIQLEEMRVSQESLTKSAEFFEEQQSIIAARIKINEFAENGSGFTVPVNYFEELADRTNKKIGIKEVQQPAKVRNLFTQAAWKYATAACIAVAVTTGIFVKQYQAAHTIQNKLLNLPDADIENYLYIHADSYDNHFVLETSATDAGASLENIKTDADSDTAIKN